MPYDPSLMTDVDYALAQLARAKGDLPLIARLDCVQRAIDGIERVKAALQAEPAGYFPDDDAA